MSVLSYSSLFFFRGMIDMRKTHLSISVAEEYYTDIGLVEPSNQVYPLQKTTTYITQRRVCFNDDHSNVVYIAKPSLFLSKP